MITTGTPPSSIGNQVLLPAWLLFSLFVGAIAATFTSLGTAAFIAAALVTPPALILVARAWSFERLTIVTLVVLSNILLIHKVIAIHSANGDNLLGIRDICLMAILAAGLYKGRDRIFSVAKHPLVWPGIVLAFLLPEALVFGRVNGASFMDGAREAFTLSMWVLPLVVAANIRSREYLRILFKTFEVLGLLISIGVILEVGSFGALQLVSTLREQVAGQLLMRVFPDAWPFMTFACISAIVGILAKQNVLRNATLFLITMAAIILTLQRGMPVVTVGGITLLILLLVLSKNPDLRPHRALIPAASFVLLIAAGALIADQISPFLNDWLSRRFGEQAIQDLSGREYEMRMVKEAFVASPIAGRGLGARYRDPLPESLVFDTGAQDDGTFCHNIEGFLFLKLGLPGLFAFLAFAMAIMIRFWRYCFGYYDSEARRFGIVITTTFVIWLVFAQTANVFGDIRCLPICGFAAAMLAALELLEIRNQNNSIVSV